MTDEERAGETLRKITTGSFLLGMEQGFIIGKGRQARPEELTALRKVCDKIMTEQIERKLYEGQDTEDS